MPPPQHNALWTPCTQWRVQQQGEGRSGRESQRIWGYGAGAHVCGWREARTELGLSRLGCHVWEPAKLPIVAWHSGNDAHEAGCCSFAGLFVLRVRPSAPFVYHSLGLPLRAAGGISHCVRAENVVFSEIQQISSPDISAATLVVRDNSAAQTRSISISYRLHYISLTA